MNVFIDTNVLLDVLAKRDGFYEQALAIWSLAERGRIRGLVSTISFNNIHYIIERLGSRAKARRAMLLLRDTFAVVDFDSQVLQQAIDAELKDFEDAVQYFSAIRAEAACLVTRNPRDFPHDGPAILTPEQFLAAHAGTL